MAIPYIKDIEFEYGVVQQMTPLIREGYIYIAQPPLYQIVRGRQATYVLNDKRMNENLVDLALAHATFAVRSVEQAHALIDRARAAGYDIRRSTW